MAGGNNEAVLSKLALPKLVDNVIADRADYAKAGLTLKVNAQLDKFSSISSVVFNGKTDHWQTITLNAVIDVFDAEFAVR